MTTQISSRLRLVLALLITALTVLALALFTFTLVDNIVHKDLYDYGLQFDVAWARLYWDNSGLFSASIAVAMLLLAFFIALILLFIRKNTASPLRLIGYVIPFVVAGLALFSVLTFTQISDIIHVNLYGYGLQPSLDWALPMQTYSISLYALLGAAAAIAILLALLFHFSIIETASAHQEYAKKVLLSTVAYPGMATLNQIILGIGFKGNPLYLPPKYFTNPETCKAYIPKKDGAAVPTLERIKAQESHLFVDAISGMLVTPPGSELMRLFEKTSGTNFNRTNLQYLRQNLPKLVVNKLEIAQNFEMETANDRIQVKIENSVYNRPSPVKGQLGAPFGSILGNAVACALAKTTGNPIVIEGLQASPDGKSESIVYRIVTTGTPSQ